MHKRIIFLLQPIIKYLIWFLKTKKLINFDYISLDIRLDMNITGNSNNFILFLQSRYSLNPIITIIINIIQSHNLINLTYIWIWIPLHHWKIVSLLIIGVSMIFLIIREWCPYYSIYGLKMFHEFILFLGHFQLCWSLIFVWWLWVEKMVFSLLA